MSPERPRWTERLERLVVVLFLLVVATGGGYVVWALTDSTVPILERGAPEALDGYRHAPKQWAAGEWVYIWRRAEVRRSVPCLLRRTLVSASVVVRLPDAYVPPLLNDGWGLRHTSTWQIPDSVTPGSYVYRVEVECQNNPLKTVRAQLTELPIYVVSNPTTEELGRAKAQLDQTKKEVEALDKYVKPQPLPPPAVKPKPSPRKGATP